MAILVTDAIDLLLDTTTHDLVIEDGDFVLSRGLDAVSQEIKIAINMIRGEWFVDRTEGVPYFERPDGTVTRGEAILGGAFSEIRAIAAIREAISTVSTVQRIDAITVKFTAGTRLLTVRFRVITVFGDTLTDNLERTI